MYKVICYVSTVANGIDETEVRQLLHYSQVKNTRLGIKGFLLFSEGNFLQVIEGKQVHINQLWAVIQEDNRHFNLIKIFENQIDQNDFAEYKADFITSNNRYTSEIFQEYINHIQQLDQNTQHAIQEILHSFIKLN